MLPVRIQRRKSMTGPEAHCGFEDYCRHYCPAFQGHNPCNRNTIGKPDCEHDTRLRPAQPKQGIIKWIENNYQAAGAFDPKDPVVDFNALYGELTAEQQPPSAIAEEQIRSDERDRVIKELTDETKIHDLRICNGEFFMATEGVIGHQLIRLLTDLYESNGGENYFTMTISGKVREKMRRYEITICNSDGKKTPAETIVELKAEIARLQASQQAAGLAEITVSQVFDFLKKTFGKNDADIDSLAYRYSLKEKEERDARLKEQPPVEEKK